MKPLISGHSAGQATRALSGPSPIHTQPVNVNPDIRLTNASRFAPRNLDSLDLASSRRSPLAPLSSVPTRLPQNAEELFKPLSLAATDMPEWIQGYLSLLAESSTSNGSIQRMLIHLIARGAADTAKLAHIISDPLDGMVDVLADSGTQMIMRQISRVQGCAPGRVSEEGTGLTEACACTTHPINPVQGKMLSILLSLMLSGLASSVATDALKGMGGEFNLHAVRTEVARSAAAGAAGAAAATAAEDASEFFRFDSMRARVGPSFMARAAPSLTSGLSTSGASMLGAGGMATSTALKMLRADSKLRSPDLGNVIGAILDTVSESTSSIDWDDKKPALSMAAASSHVGQRHGPLGQGLSRLEEAIGGHSPSHLGQGPPLS